MAATAVSLELVFSRPETTLSVTRGTARLMLEQEYGPFCDALYFAVAPEFPQDILPEAPGLIVADGFGGAVVRTAPVSPLAPARRKALTLAFARLGAMRTMRD
ncbi:MAG: hypothetical protein B7Y85_12065 [Brevundimonas sp. 32-68-21]|nr:MAG: hypothetical protein B7Y85_12065 [Brevundimonas sp. 32-68-21]